MKARTETPIEFRLLGPVEADRDGEQLALGGPRLRTLLALLLLEPGRPVPVDRLTDELWRGRPPSAAATTLRTYVSRLRSVLGDAAEINGGAAGYALEVEPEAVDAWRFERLAREGQDALARGASARARERLNEGLTLWRGRPFGDLADEGALLLEAERLAEIRLSALEDRLEAELSLGGSAELVDELETLVRQHPYRERLWRQLMLALYRGGRQADALEAYRRARTVLDEELGLEPGVELRELEQSILRHDVDPASPPEEQTNLPAPVTSFVGRERELAELQRLLRDSRLLTLSGVGGVGKTRLALEVARLALADFPDGVWFVDLAPLADAALVPAEVGAALDVREQAGEAIESSLVRRLRDAELLLVLDNCEHLREACAELAERLLLSIPALRILATSRERLGVHGELDYAVPPLSLADDAVELLLARARAARPALADHGDAPAVAAQICADLDGLPLAIELAAARAKALSLPEIAQRLSDRFRFLVSWRRLTAARHRTLREAMDWSYELLHEDERAVLDCLSVFAGGFDLEAAAAVCVEGDEQRALEIVEHLVDASLVIAEERDGTMRYRMLETVRQYTAERLMESGESDGVRRRHAEYYVAFIEGAYELLVSKLDRWVELVSSIQENLRAALTWSRDADGDLLLHLAGQVWRFWWVRGDLTEGLRWLEEALDRSSEGEAKARALALEGAAGLAWAAGDMQAAETWAEEERVLFVELGDKRGEIAAVTVLAHVALVAGKAAAARRLFERTQSLSHEIGMPAHLAMATFNVGTVAALEGELDTAEHLYQEARALYEESSDPYGIALTELYSAIAYIEGGRDEDAALSLRSALPVFREMEFPQYSTQCVEAAAIVLHRRGDAIDAVRLLGGANAIRDRIGDPPGGVPEARARVLEVARTELGDGAFEAAWAEGRALSEDTVLELAHRLLTG